MSRFGAPERLPSNLTIDQIHGLVYIDDVTVDVDVLKAMAKDEPRVLWRFIRKDGKIIAIPYSEEEVVWLEKREKKEIAVGWYLRRKPRKRRAR